MADVGVVIVGHGTSASALLGAAAGVLGPGALEGVAAIDAGLGQSAELERRMHDAVAAADVGAGVLLIADMLGASPCTCGVRQAMGHRLAVLAGLNLAMLLKLATLDRGAQGPAELAAACAESARRAITVQTPKPAPEPPAPAPEPPAQPSSPHAKKEP